MNILKFYNKKSSDFDDLSYDVDEFNPMASNFDFLRQYVEVYDED